MKSRKALVYFKKVYCGVLEEVDAGYQFTYDQGYLTTVAKAISFTLPLQSEPFVSKTMFAFFDGLIPEGWLLNLALSNWKIKERDRMGLLLASCGDCIGAVSISDV